MVPGRASSSKRRLTSTHKKALAQGKSQARIVETYLEALESDRPPRGRRVDLSPERFAALDRQIADATGVRKLELVQRKLDLEQLAKTTKPVPDLDQLAKDFVKVAKAFSARKGISYTAWRQLGVPAEILRRAGITRRASR